MASYPLKFGIRFTEYGFHRIVGIIFTDYRLKICLYKYRIEIGMIEDCNWRNNIKVSVMKKGE
jgi:hypothetical protein